MRIKNRRTRLVVVDEATSSLDPVAEHDILTEFHKVRSGKTIVFVTHRFYHFAHEADRIMYVLHVPSFFFSWILDWERVLLTHRDACLALDLDRCMKNGGVVGNGTHAELLRDNGDYAALYHAQAKWST